MAAQFFKYISQPWYRVALAVNAPAAFHPSVSADRRQAAPSGPGWAHDSKHDGYRLRSNVPDGQVGLYPINGADWSKRYPLIVDALKLSGLAGTELRTSTRRSKASALAALSLTRLCNARMVNGDDLRRRVRGR